MNELLCKWIGEDMTTRNNTHWEIGKPNELPEKEGLKLCEEGLFHYCIHPILAQIFKKLHGCDHYTQLYEVKPEGKIVQRNDKCGSTKLTLLRKLNESEVPELSLTNKIAFGILCSLEVYKEENYVIWANNWLKNIDRTAKSAGAAWSAWSASDAAYYAARSAASRSAYAAAAYAAAAAADADAAWSAIWSKESNPNIDLIKLAQRALEIN